MGDVVLVAGAGGFIGGHLAAALARRGARVRCADVKPVGEWFQRVPGADERCLDLSRAEACAEAVAGTAEVYNLAADMGGMGFIERHRARCMLSVLINTHLLQAAARAGVGRYFFASSACVYNVDRQRGADDAPLREEDAYPALPEDGYGWEKLFGERMCRHFREDFGLETRVARYHNVYGPHGTWDGGREKAPAAVCRKVAEAVDRGTGEIEVWGDGTQRRSFLYVDDCVEGTLRLMASDAADPVNLGSEEAVTVDELVGVVEELAGVRLRRVYRPDAPQGVRSRNSDNTRLRRALGWEPATPLRDGMARTYVWVHDQYHARQRNRCLYEG